MPLPLPLLLVQPIVDAALAEDLGLGDPTTETLIPYEWQGVASLRVKAPGVLAGLPVAELAFRRVDPAVRVETLVEDGSQVEPGQVVARIAGPVASILRAERVALNFLQRMSGIASETARYVAAVADLPVRIIDTRKTVPGLRLLDKYAVRMGGGHNHRQNLADGVLIKDNHLAALETFAGLGVADAVREARRRASHTLNIEVEADTLDQVRQALEGGADIILLDNMTPEQMREAVEMVAGRAITEASGGITLATVRAVAETGVDLISVGSLTHSTRALDISLDLEFVKG
ncbi:MAG: carboxylating nicotinate-nucleotide diphosphorylase [Chloroflexi bacterium]|nr:carboxylating nicotinate-nucleotide diphosphorylase [Chloroflexota bacterium]